jgi:hypothetical protein
VDKNDGHKGIYFTTFEEAESIRIVLTQRYRYTGNLLKLMAVFNKNYLDETAEIFKTKLISRHKMLEKSRL